jgi:hypothetical protein
MNNLMISNSYRYEKDKIQNFNNLPGIVGIIIAHWNSYKWSDFIPAFI